MSLFTFRRMREQNEAAKKAASLAQPKPKPKQKKQSKKNGDNLN